MRRRGKTKWRGDGGARHKQTRREKEREERRERERERERPTFACLVSVGWVRLDWIWLGMGAVWLWVGLVVVSGQLFAPFIFQVREGTRREHTGKMNACALRQTRREMRVAGDIA